MPDRVHDPGDAGRQARRVGRRGRAAARATAAPPWRCASCGPRSAARARRPTARPRRSRARTSRRSRRRRSARRRGRGPWPASRRPAASTARRMMPDAQMSLKTPRSSRSRYMRRASPSSSSNSARCSSGTCERMPAMRASTSRRVACRAVDRRSDRAQQRVGQLERVAPGDVEAVEQPTADEVEILRHRRADLAVERAQLGERLAGVAVGVEERASGRCRA